MAGDLDDILELLKTHPDFAIWRGPMSGPILDITITDCTIRMDVLPVEPVEPVVPELSGLDRLRAVDQALVERKAERARKRRRPECWPFPDDR